MAVLGDNPVPVATLPNTNPTWTVEEISKSLIVSQYLLVMFILRNKLLIA
jgi:hypothetical protein